MSRRTLTLIFVFLLLLLLIFLLWWFFIRNEPPTAVADSAMTVTSTAVTGNVRENDSDSRDATEDLEVVENPATMPSNGSVILAMNGDFIYTPNAGYVGEDAFRYRICDTRGACAVGNVAIVVLEAPVANDDVFETNQNSELVGDVLGNDTPAGGLTAPTVTQTPVNGSVIFTQGGSFTYLPNEDYIGEDSFAYESCLADADAFCDSAVVTIMVKEAIDPDVVDAVDDNYNTPINTAVTENVLTNDKPAADQLTVTDPLTALPANGTVGMSADGAFTYTPNTDFTGPDTFTYEACNSGAVCDTAVVTITVGVEIGVDARDDSYDTEVNNPVSGNVLDNDVPTGELTVSAPLIDDPDSGDATVPENGEFTYTPDTDFVGNDAFTYEACNANNECDTAVVSIQVADIGAPIVEDDAFETVINTELIGNVLENDSDPNDLALTAANTPIEDATHGTVVISDNGDFSYVPETDYTGEDSFVYEVCNSDNKCAQGEVTITIAAVTKHTVVRGEWLLQIARCYGTSAHAIAKANRIRNPHHIYPGQMLTIPHVGSIGSYSGPPCIETYTVQKGDTPTSIAAQFDISLHYFMRINGIPKPNGFHVGQFIVIPRPVPDFMQPK